MSKFKFYFILLITTASIFSCQKDDDDNFTPTPPRDYKTQYDADIAVIEEYLKSNYIDLRDPNYADKDPIIEKITDPATQPSLMSYLDAGSFPSLKTKTVEQDGIVYTLYYLILREGIGESPCNVDGVFTAYEGSYLYSSVTTTPLVVNSVMFEKVVIPSDFFSLFSTITGWGETFPEFKTGTSVEHEVNGKPDGTIDYSDFGAGVMFLPSGLAYYNQIQASIPSYSPLVFSFKLYDIKRLDQDGDGVPSHLEDLNNDGYIRVLPATNIDRYVDDTDKDGLPDAFDIDDDGDNYTTKLEIKDPATGLAYPFDLIPTCTTGTETKKNYLVPTCHP
ncbi:MAG TPA: FKBP-type peptidylprolyl isomerase [Flavobacterium sp.]